MRLVPLVCAALALFRAEASDKVLTRTFDAPDSVPVVYGMWSRTEGYCARGAQCDLWLDVEHTDGSHYRRESGFGPVQGTHGWQLLQSYYNPFGKKIRKVTIRYYARNPVGRIEIRDMFIERRNPDPFIETARRVSDAPRSNRHFLQMMLPLWKGAAWESVTSDGRRSSGVADGGSATGRVVCVEIGPEQGALDLTLSLRGGRKVVEHIAYDAAPRTDNPLPDDGIRVWATDSSRRVFGCEFPGAKEGDRGRLDLARGGRGAVQVLVSTGRHRRLDSVSLRTGRIRTSAGGVFRGRVRWLRVGYVPRMPYHYCVPGNPEDARTLWVPDPLLPAQPFRVAEGSTRAAWIVCEADRDCPAGLYCGEVPVESEGRRIGAVRIEVRVRGFALPREFGMRTIFSLSPHDVRIHYPDDAARRLEEAEDLLLDARVCPDNLDRMVPIPAARARRLLDRGSRQVCLLSLKEFGPKDDPARVTEFDLGWRPDIVESGRVKGGSIAEGCYEGFRERIRPAYEDWRKAGLLDRAYIYGFDEKKFPEFEAIREFDRRLKEDFPAVKFMTTARMMEYRRTHPEGTNAWTFTDWHCPVVHRWGRAARDEIVAAGKEPWWYIMGSPFHPMANFAPLEMPPGDGVTVGWETWVERSRGVLYWLANGWKGRAKCDDGQGEFFPGFKMFGCSAGDGVLVYPGASGPLGSIRLFKVGEGVQFYEWLEMAESRAGRERTEELLGRIHRSLRDFSRDPDEVFAARAALGDMIEQAKGER